MDARALARNMSGSVERAAEPFTVEGVPGRPLAADPTNEALGVQTLLVLLVPQND